MIKPFFLSSCSTQWDPIIYTSKAIAFSLLQCLFNVYNWRNCCRAQKFCKPKFKENEDREAGSWKTVVYLSLQMWAEVRVNADNKFALEQILLSIFCIEPPIYIVWYGMFITEIHRKFIDAHLAAESVYTHLTCFLYVFRAEEYARF